MKNMTLVFLVLSSLLVQSCSKKDAATTAEAPNPTGFNGSWITATCMDMSGKGNDPVYGKIYLVISGYNEYAAVLNFGTDSECAGEYTMVSINDQSTVTEPELLATIDSLIELADMPAGFSAWKFKSVGDDVNFKYSLAYTDGTIFYSPFASISPNTPEEAPASTWSAWLAAEGGKLSDFGNSPTTKSVPLVKISSLP